MPGAQRARRLELDGALFVHRQTVTAPEDLQARQPGTGRDGRLVVLFDGYLTNRPVLADRLGLEEDAADASYALAALERWGDGALPRLEGDFALAAWEADRRRLLMGIDILGSRPLYYHQGDGWLAFATNIRPLLALPGIPRDLDDADLADHLLDLPVAEDATYYAAIRRVPAAGAVVSGGRVETRRYWRVEEITPIRYRRDEDYVDAARELLDRSVKACLRLTGPAVSTISGGLDSAAVAVTAARLLGRPLTTVTAVTEPGLPEIPLHVNDFSDERPLVEAIARHQPYIQPVFCSGSGPHSWDRRWREVYLRIGMPVRNVMNLSWFAPIYDHAADLGANVLLTGVYGNRTLSWTGHGALAGAVRRGRWLHVLDECRSLARQTGTPLSRHLWQQAIGPALPEGLRERIYSHFRPSHFSSVLANFAIRDDFAKETGALDRMRGFQRDLRRPGLRELLQRRSGARTPIMGLMRYLYGLEFRSPLGNRQLLEFCFAIPEDQYLRGGQDRFLARRVLADRLPAEVTGNRGRGFQCAEFFHRMGAMRDVLAAGVEELERSPLATRVLDVPSMRRLLEEWPADAEKAGVNYLSVLYRGLHYGQYLRWIEGGN